MGDTITLTTYADAKDAYRHKELRQALYDEGEVIMAEVLVNLHGAEHRARRRVENRIFRRETFEHHERDLFPQVIEATLKPYTARGGVDLVKLGHELMLNLAALTAGVDRPLGTPEETWRLYDYMMLFIEGATLAHSTRDTRGKDERRTAIRAALGDFQAEFLDPSIARRRAALGQLDAGEFTEDELPKDVLTTLLRHEDDLGLRPEELLRETAFMLLAGAHTSATAFVRTIDHILTWTEHHPGLRPSEDRAFVQRCMHETIRLNPSSPVGMRWALAPITLRSGIEIAQGDKVVIDLMAVNRDPEVFGPTAAEFDPARELPQGVTPYGMSFGGGMHVCIGQDLAAGVVQDTSGEHLYGLVTIAVQQVFAYGVRRDPQHPPRKDTTTKRPYWGNYPVLFAN